MSVRVLQTEAARRLDEATVVAAISTMVEVILEHLRDFGCHHDLVMPVSEVALNQAEAIDKFATAMVATLRKMKTACVEEGVTDVVKGYLKRLSVWSAWASQYGI